MERKSKRPDDGWDRERGGQSDLTKDRLPRRHRLPGVYRPVTRKRPGAIPPVEGTEEDVLGISYQNEVFDEKAFTRPSIDMTDKTRLV